MPRTMKVSCRCDYCRASIEDIEDGDEVPEGWVDVRVTTNEGLIRRNHICTNCIDRLGGVIPMQTVRDASLEPALESSCCVVIGNGAPGPEASQHQTLFFGLDGKNLVTFDFSGEVPSISIAPMGGKHPIEDMVIALEKVCASFREKGLDELLEHVSVDGIEATFGSPEYMKAVPFASVLTDMKKATEK